jgi:phage-related protein
VAREFVPYDEEQIDAEYAKLEASSERDAAKLDFVMERIEDTAPNENPSPAVVWTFEEGFKELRHMKGDYKGRLLFYEPTLPKGTEELVMLVIFRKQTQKTPKGEIAKAVKRMAADIEKRKQDDEKQ